MLSKFILIIFIITPGFYITPAQSPHSWVFRISFFNIEIFWLFGFLLRNENKTRQRISPAHVPYNIFKNSQTSWDCKIIKTTSAATKAQFAFSLSLEWKWLTRVDRGGCKNKNIEHVSGDLLPHYIFLFLHYFSLNTEIIF